jgi:hypothetical protein
VADSLGGPVRVISDGWTAYLTVDHRAAVPDVRFVHSLDPERAAELRRQGTRLFHVPEADWNYRAARGVGLERLGSEPLPGLAPR